MKTTAPIDPLRLPPPPKDRPHCLYCGKVLRPFLFAEYDDGEVKQLFWAGAYYGYNEEFHTLREALAFASAAARAGYRMKSK